MGLESLPRRAVGVSSIQNAEALGPRKVLENLKALA
jgi:hypothetical protein